MPNFKVGDKVRVVATDEQLRAYLCNTKIRQGSTHTVTQITGDEICKLDGLSRGWAKQDFVELVTTFTKQDLKDGMQVTYRDGGVRVVLGGKLYVVDGQHYYRQANDLRHYRGDLKFRTIRTKDHPTDIMKVQYMQEVLWEREEEQPEEKDTKKKELVVLLNDDS